MDKDRNFKPYKMAVPITIKNSMYTQIDTIINQPLLPTQLQKNEI